jgi:solute carrier family 25 iron transporter 28/37
MQVHGSTYSNVFQCASSILKKEGFKAFYISYPTTLTITIPFTSIQFMTYEATLDIFNPKREYNPFYHSMSGAIAGATAAAITTPLDVVKTLLQTRGSSIDPEVRKCSGLVQAAKLIYKKEGAKGFSKGMAPRILSHMPSTALCWTAYEYFKWFLKETNPATSS